MQAEFWRRNGAQALLARSHVILNSAADYRGGFRRKPQNLTLQCCFGSASKLCQGNSTCSGSRIVPDCSRWRRPVQQANGAVVAAAAVAARDQTEWRAVQLSAEDLLDWKIYRASNKTFVGTVEDVIQSDETHISPQLVKVVNRKPEGVPAGQDLCEKHMIPFVPDIFVQLDETAQEAFIKPPKGLLQLGRQQLLIDIIAPRILEVAGGGGQAAEAGRLQQPLAMPTRPQLQALGEEQLIRGITDAGGFLAVAQRLGLRTPRKPNGFWDNIENLDEELSLFIAANWMELPDAEEGEPYYHNTITGRSQWVEPQPPTKFLLDDEGTMLLAEDEQDRVMPSRKDVTLAGRYDLHHAIVYHGGYRVVAEALDRTHSWPKNRLATDRGALLRELQSVQRQIFGGGSQMPSAQQLLESGRPDVLQAVAKSGGFHKVAALAGLTACRKPAGHWNNVDSAVAELEAFTHSQLCTSEPGWFPSCRELLAAGRRDLHYAVQVHGSKRLADLMGLRVRTAGRKPKRKQAAAATVVPS